MDVDVTNNRLDGVTVVALSGELVGVALELDGLFTELVRQLAIRIVVDLSAVTACDPVGLRALADAQRRCWRLGGYLRLVTPSMIVMRTLAALDVLAPAAVYQTVEDACNGDPSKLIALPDKPARVADHDGG
jgi:anti-anti-sigma factor